ncbi:serine hydrolase [Mesorhizobium sp. RMAD-H1]|uniref:serine hydrolase domain-containing protein n=1 Tax=Mesorhizobium sp. RMAD-H1 TaxID=2587065 RepID=UPI0016128C54|nr:serine hydrolase [Mesorhizobium sp. RMAD-H1]MBB2971680.1 CubicO group peptidase (beta-lactamase class C family) [Mesorhizobium sp. RMAD-H1]
MVTRRSFAALLASGLAMPFVLRAHAQNIEDLRGRIESMTQLHSLQVQRGEDVLFAEAPRGPGLNGSANIKSCAKSLVALLLGVAIDRGEIADVKARLGDVAPGIIPSNATHGVADITMEDLVTLRAGLEPTSGPNYGRWVSSDNWLAFALRRPMVASPGSRMIYSSGTTHILGAALAEATGESLLEQARSRLGAPVKFDIPPWTRDPQGYYLGGNEMALTPRAMLKIAVMLRDEGRFEGRQVVPAEWIKASLVPHGRSPFSGLGYGYGWFLSESGFALARGYGGQVIAAHPERRLAVAITSDPTQRARSEGYFGELMGLIEGPILALA